MFEKKKILLITPENEEINKFRKKQFNNFIQISEKTRGEKNIMILLKKIKDKQKS